MAKSKQTKPEIYVDYGDVHYPDVHWPTFHALCDFLKHNKVDGFIFGGDQFDNSNSISHWTKGKPRQRDDGSYLRDEKDFDKKILSPIEKLLPADAEKVWVSGNHDHFEEQYVDEHPEMNGMQRQYSLRLKERGWQFVETGKHYKKGKLTIIHGEQLSGFGNQNPTGHSKKALEVYGQNVLYHHFHAPQSATKIMPFDEEHKYMAWCAPCGSEKNPLFLRNRATAWLSGFTIILYWGDKGFFNLYPVITTHGTFAFGDRIYGA